MQPISLRVTRYALVALLFGTLPLSAALFDFSTGNSYGFTNGTNTSGSWSFTSNSWQMTYDVSSDVSLLSPILTTTGGDVTLQFTHSRNFESTFDGGIVELALNGGTFNKVAAGSFSQNGYDQDITGGLANPVFSGTFATRTSIADLGALAAGNLLQVRWHSTSDDSINPTPPNWVLNSVSLSAVLDSSASAATGIPEPATLSLAAIALAGALLLRKYHVCQA